MHRKLASDRKILDGKRTKTKNERNLTDEFKKTNGKLNLIYIWAYWHCSLEFGCQSIGNTNSERIKQNISFFKSLSAALL